MIHIHLIDNKFWNVYSLIGAQAEREESMIWIVE